jgi:hypothetical protein
MSWGLLKSRVSGLLRTRVILSIIGLIVMCRNPEIAQWVVAIVGLALGVSAIDAVKDGNRNEPTK